MGYIAHWVDWLSFTPRQAVLAVQHIDCKEKDARKSRTLVKRFVEVAFGVYKIGSKLCAVASDGANDMGMCT
jgi:hypothetical protein